MFLIRNLYLPDSDCKILTLLGLHGPIELSAFAKGASQLVYPKSDPENRVQTVRNRILLLQKKGLIVKDNSKNKNVALSFEIEKNGNVLLDYKFLAADEPKN